MHTKILRHGQNFGMRSKPDAGAGYPIPDASTTVIGTYKFKIVATSGTIGTAIKRDHVNTANYAELSKYLGLSN